VDAKAAKLLYDWYYNPGEVLRSIGFYVNPYKQWKNAKFEHVFAVDANYNLYVGQYSVYQEHIDRLCDLKDKREYGTLWVKSTPIVEFTFLETRNITYLNRRLKRIAQRLYDYGMPGNTMVVSPTVDLWYMTLDLIMGDLKLERPEKELLDKQIN